MNYYAIKIKGAWLVKRMYHIAARKLIASGAVVRGPYRSKASAHLYIEAVMAGGE